MGRLDDAEMESVIREKSSGVHLIGVRTKPPSPATAGDSINVVSMESWLPSSLHGSPISP